MTTTKPIIPCTGVSSLDRAVAMATPQSLVHIKHTISLQQYKYFLLFFDEMCLLMDSGIETDENGFYTIRMEKITEKIGYTPNKKELWNDLVKLKNETIAVNYLMKDGQPIKYGAGYISEWGISNSFVKFKFPTFFVEVAKKFKEQRRLFLLLNWEIFNSFTGKYEAILYKLCKDYENSGGKRTPQFTIESYKEYIGVGQDEYKVFKDLNKFCISKPIQKINESEISDIKITLQAVKTGKFITSFYFLIESKKQQVLPIENDPIDDPFMLARVPIPANLQSEFLREHTIDDAKLCIEAANEWIDAKTQAGEVVVHGKIYRMALKENWKPNKPIIQQQEKEIKDKKDAVVKEQKQKENEEEKRVKEQKEWLENTLATFNNLSEERKFEIRTAYANTLSEITRKSFEKQAEKAPLHRLKFAKFFIEKYGE